MVPVLKELSHWGELTCKQLKFRVIRALRWVSPGCFGRGMSGKLPLTLGLAGCIEVLFGRWGIKGQHEERPVRRHEATPPIVTLLTGLFSQWSQDLSKHLAAGLLFAFPEIKQTNQVTSKPWLGVTPVLTYKSRWTLTQCRCFSVCFLGKCSTVSPWANLHDDASRCVMSWTTTREEKAIYGVVHPVGASSLASPAFVIPVTWLSPVLREDVRDMTY